ncbi:NADP-dependent phosphogluconate dehydrogenase [Candidatus Nitrosacidococcus tergens]|uniref:6-phosphogluconate dehydrogenase, decarboxylating n=1 Tax=Candidatus Nitrosacidococcus tergens TaxID=553981 RepID=A0A7G1QA65_9GAMM|nr:NADP-dependent phosphogluconate dehydrogenase [Candidatus Nitrosacidococcus tergens]CAB1276446.1 6-phosphogluconate dehydrogenase, decarboxylating [Candidatus Nitrosacidococcus tergens]
MAETQKTSADIGIVGLGVMGANLGLNIAENGFTVVAYDRDSSKGSHLTNMAQEQLSDPSKINAYNDITQFIIALKKPRTILMLVPAGAPVDAVIHDFAPHLEAGDIMIDGGNSFFKDTNRRVEELAKKNIHFMGMGVSGGESGARHGPSLMPGGDRTAWEHAKPILEAAAAKADGEPCVGWLGRGAAGHYVKMVHNGIEYGLMELITESYDIMHRGLGLNLEELHKVYKEWTKGPMGGFLMEITADVLVQKDPLGDGYILPKILDTAHQKGTGLWTSEESLTLQAPTPVIDAAVTQRVLSSTKDQRLQASQKLAGPKSSISFNGDKTAFIAELGNALYGAMMLTYAQGIHLLQVANKAYDYGLVLETVAAVWREGCIIRSQLLKDLRNVYRNSPDLINPILDTNYSAKIVNTQENIRKVITTATPWGLPIPGFTSALSYYDTYRSAQLPANLLQAQRDYFGAHTFERVDQEGTFHIQWSTTE